MYKKNTDNSKQANTQEKDLLSTVNKIVDEKSQIEILDFEENTKYDEKKKEIKKTSNISKQINRKLNADEVLDFDKTTAFEPIKLNNVKKQTKNKKQSNIKKTSKITKQVNRKLNADEVLDFDKTTAFEPIKINNVKKQINNKKQQKNKITLSKIIKNIKKTYKNTNKKVKRKLNQQEVLDFDKTTTFEPINLDKYKEPKSRKELLNRYMKVKKTITTCVIFTFLFLGFQQITTENSIIKQQTRKVLASLGIYTEEINSTSIESPNYGEETSWKIDRSAKWIDTNKVELTINLNSIIKANEKNKNIILILDTSKSMTGEKLDTLKDVLKEYIEYILKDNTVQLSIVTFSNSYKVEAYLTNDKDLLLDKVDNITLEYDTNYAAAIRSINALLDKNRTDGEDTVAVLITDGYPNIETGSHEGEYNLVKDIFPKLKVKAIQFEVGNTIIDELKKVSDTQNSATKSNIKRVLFEATVSPEVYETFKITDYLSNDYFKIENLSDIKTTMGTPMILEDSGVQKIEWTMDDNYVTGEAETLKAILTLKDEYVTVEDLYLINENTNVTSKRKNIEEVSQEYKNPLLLNNVYEVIYQNNKPDGCSIPSSSTEYYFVSTNVSKLSNELSCPGYLFKGWELTDEDEKEIQKINTDVFLMPSHNITLKGTWTKQALTVSMDGKINEKTTLYNVIAKEAEEGIYAKEYTGEHQDSMDPSLSTEKIYHYYASTTAAANEVLNKNNVIFADQCWQMIRTTDTGGVKLIYNGEQENNQCLNTRGTHAGYNSTSSQTLTSNYWYGTSYVYDKLNKTFKLSGNLETATWSETTGPNLVGKYTCKKTGPDSTCTTLYYIESVKSSSQANTLVLNNNSHYSQLGEMEFSENFYNPVEVSYMYNKEYTSNVIVESNYDEYSLSSLNTSYYYAEEAEWDSELNKYVMSNPKKITSEDYIDLPGKYAFNNTDESGTATKVEYIVGIDEIYYYYITLSNGNNLDYYDYTYTYGDSYTENEDGTYTINNPRILKRKEWFTNHNNINNKYACKNAIENSCTDIMYIKSTGIFNKSYFISNKIYKYSNRYIYDGTNYILDEESSINIWDTSTEENKQIINNAHYTCKNLTGICKSLSYVYYNSTGTNWEVSLKNGENIEEALYNMLNSDSESAINSRAKSSIEAWYTNYLIDYSNYIEDTIYCNDRTVIDKAGWNPNGGSITTPLKFKNYNITNNLKCSRESDMFSINNPKAKIKYKIGLMTASEMNLLNNDILRNTSNYYFTLTPSNSDSSSKIYNITSYGGQYSRNASYEAGLRPAISLRPGIEYLEGDGSMETPYIIDTTE